MTQDNVKLARLRAAIDDIDDKLLSLLERRVEAARAVSAIKGGWRGVLKLCPAREAEVVRRLEARSSAVSRPAVRHIWRELMGHCLQVQARTDLIIKSGEDRLQTLAREVFGSAPNLVRVDTEEEALKLAADSQAIALVSYPPPTVGSGLRVFRTICDEQGVIIAAAVGRVAPEACWGHPSGDEPAWSPGSWRRRKALQMPLYADVAAISAVEAELSNAAPVVAIDEAAELKEALADAVEGNAFLLQGGDCAESFADFSAEQVIANHDLLLELGRLLPSRVVHVARAAGQFAKPRSVATEVHAGVSMPAYRGDAVNSTERDRSRRTPDPMRLLRAHRQSLATAKILDGLGAAAKLDGPFGSRIYASHEALLLNYEQALTRRDERTGKWWATSGHMVWIGERTRDLDGAHVEYARGIANSIGVKCGSGLEADELLRLLDRLDPANEPGRVVLIGRFGAHNVGRSLPLLMRATRSAGRKALWACDPMHGNGRAIQGQKTRLVEDVVAELRSYFQIAEAEGVHPGGLHLEQTARAVTECIGGLTGIAHADLGSRYESLCDPRLNRAQSFEVVGQAASHLARRELPKERAA
jgi:3-deoxy-7-phosphoheptulonate synthase